MLRYLAQYNTTVRCSLAVEKSLYLDIVKARILCNNNEAFHYEASCLLMLLVFDDFVKKDEVEAVSLPDIIGKRWGFVYL